MFPIPPYDRKPGACINSFDHFPLFLSCVGRAHQAPRPHVITPLPLLLFRSSISYICWTQRLNHWPRVANIYLLFY